MISHLSYSGKSFFILNENSIEASSFTGASLNWQRNRTFATG